MSSQYIKYPKAVPVYPSASAFPLSAPDGDLAIALDSHDLYEYETGTGWVAIAGPGVGGTVTSVALSAPVEFVVSGSPITTAGTLTLTKAVEPANTVYAGPTSGGSAQPTFRALVSADMPAGAGSPLTTKGDLYGFSTVNARIPVGANGLVLTADSTNSLGVSWQVNAGGDVVGPGSATDNALARFSGTTGKLIKNSNAILSDAGALSLVSTITASNFSGSSSGTNTGDITVTDTATIDLTLAGQNLSAAVIGATASELAYLVNNEPLTTVSMADNQAAAANVATWAFASFTSIQLDYSISRGAGNRESGRIVIATDGSTAGIGQDFGSIGVSGVTFSVDISGATVRLRYTSTNTGTAPTMKYKVQKWLA